MTVDKAVQNLTEIVELNDEEINNNNENVSAILDLEDIKSLKMVLQHLKFYKEGLEREIDANRKNVIEIIQQDKEIEKKDKIINKMAEYIRVDDIEENDDIDLCDFLSKKYNDCKHLSSACENCIKEYFEKKVEK